MESFPSIREGVECPPSPHLLELQLSSYKEFKNSIEGELRNILNGARITIKEAAHRELPYTLCFDRASIQENDEENRCFAEGKPFLLHISCDVTFEDASINQISKSFSLYLPAMTSRASFFYGALPRERVIISQLRPKRETFLAKEIKEIMAEANIRDRSKQKKIRGIVNKFNRKYGTNYTEHDIQNLLKMDTEDIRNYDIILAGNILKEAFIYSLKEIKNFLTRQPLAKNALEPIFNHLIPKKFASLFERYLNNSGCWVLLDKTNPLSELSHKREITFCGRGGIRHFQVYLPEREVHPSHFGLLCPLETPETEKIGLNLHFVFDVKREGGKLIPSEEHILGVSASLIPFISHNDMNRASMGARYLKQALPLKNLEPPLVKTGYETKVGRESGLCIIAEEDGEIVKLTVDEIVIKYNGTGEKIYKLAPVLGAQPGTGSFYRFPPDLVETSKVEGKVTQCIGNKVYIEVNGKRIEHAIPDNYKIAVSEGQAVKKGDILAFRKSFKKGDVLVDSSATLNGELCLGANLLVAYMPWYGWNFEDAIVVSEEAQEKLTSLHLVEENGNLKIVEKKLQVGDKLANRHGNKGVVSLILPRNEMPKLPDGTPIEVILNPLGVLARMNIGQLLETHWGWVAKKKWKSLVFPPFTNDLEINGESLKELLKDTGLPNGKAMVKWTRDGNEYSAEVVVGYQYILKLNHLAEDKFSYRTNEGEREIQTRQPMEGKTYQGGQKVGEMEVWALQAYDAKHIIEELLTYRSDTLKINDKPTLPESFRALVMYLRALGMDLQLWVKDKGGEKEFPVEKFLEPFNPKSFSKLKICFADDNKIKKWGNPIEKEEDLEGDRTNRENMGYIDLPNKDGFANPLRAKAKKDDCQELPKLRYIPVIPPAFRPFMWDEERKKEYGLTKLYKELLRKKNAKALEMLFLGKGYGLCAHLEGKEGLLRGHLLGKRIDWSGRAVIVPAPDLPFGCFRLPWNAASKIKDFENKIFLLNRAPTLHRYNAQAFYPDPKCPSWTHNVLGIHPLICGVYNADFDGDTMAFYHLESEVAVKEAKEKMTPINNLFSSANGNFLPHIAQDIVAGLCMYARKEEGKKWLAEKLEIGKETLEDDLLDRGKLQQLIREFAIRKWQKGKKDEIASTLDEIMKMGFSKATENPPSFSYFDLPELEEDELKNVIEEFKSEVIEGSEREKFRQFLEKVGDKLLEKMKADKDNPVSFLVLSKARGDKLQVARIGGASALPSNGNIPSNYKKGLSKMEYFSSSKYARSDMMDKKLGPPQTGYLMRKLVYSLYPLKISMKECCDDNGLEVPIEPVERLWGRVLAEDVNSKLKKGTIIKERDIEQLRKMAEDGVLRNIRIYSPLTCKAEEGICARCYGLDLSNPLGEFPPVGLPIGIISAQSIGERGTQEIMRHFHGAEEKVPLENIKKVFDKDNGPFNSLEEVYKEMVGKKLREAYGNSVDDRHFELALRQMLRKKDGQLYLSSLLKVARGYEDKSFLAAALFDQPIRVFISAAMEGKEDTLCFPSARLLLCFYDILNK